MSVKLRVKLGLLEFDYEGSEDFLKAELSSILDTLSQMKIISALAENGNPIGADIKLPPDANKGAASLQMTTGSIAAKLGCNSGPELILAACARLVFVLGNETFNRTQILQEMRTASAYYKQSYGTNLTKQVSQLVKSGKLIERSKDQYSLHASQRSQIEAQLAQ